MLRLDDRVADVIQRHPSVRSVRQVGSRAERRAGPLSDWDFVVESEDFGALVNDLPSLCAPLTPLSQQWDRLSTHYVWMLVLHGPAKVDLIFPDTVHEPESPWRPSAKNLVDIDRHFWDWMLWLGSKHSVGDHDLVASELDKLFVHILDPLGVERRPLSIEEAVAEYERARAGAEERFGCRVPHELEAEVIAVLPISSR
jgi:hypothetical protein